MCFVILVSKELDSFKGGVSKLKDKQIVSERTRQITASLKYTEKNLVGKAHCSVPLDDFLFPILKTLTFDGCLEGAYPFFVHGRMCGGGGCRLKAILRDVMGEDKFYFSHFFHHTFMQ